MGSTWGRSMEQWREFEKLLLSELMMGYLTAILQDVKMESMLDSKMLGWQKDLSTAQLLMDCRKG